jgi:hypothetical protein
VNDLPKALLCATLSALKTVYKLYKAANDPPIKPIVRSLFVRSIDLKLSKLVAKSLQTLEQGNFQGHKSMRNIYHTLDKQISSLVDETFLAYSNKHGLKQLQFQSLKAHGRKLAFTHSILILFSPNYNLKDPQQAAQVPPIPQVYLLAIYERYAGYISELVGHSPHMTSPNSATL